MIRASGAQRLSRRVRIADSLCHSRRNRSALVVSEAIGMAGNQMSRLFPFGLQTDQVRATESTSLKNAIAADEIDQMPVVSNRLSLNLAQHAGWFTSHD